MASGCIAGCGDARAPVRATYVNLYKWPESDAEFVKSVSRSGCGDYRPPRVVDSYWCRQAYLRSYTFSRKESMRTRTRRCIQRARARVVPHTTGSKEGGRRLRKSPKAKSKERCATVLGKVQELTCAALGTMFRRLLSCTTSVDVVDH